MTLEDYIKKNLKDTKYDDFISRPEYEVAYQIMRMQYRIAESRAYLDRGKGD